MQRALLLRFSAACLCVAVSSACGSSKSLADQLSPSATTLTALTITFNTPAVGGSVQATATATFSNGSTSPVSSGFGSDTPTVATISSSGSVTGVAVGDVTIFVDYQGMRATKRVRVLPSYAGIFVGTYTVNGCIATGDFAGTEPDDLCVVFSNQRVLQIATNSTQAGDLTTLTGQFALGGLLGNGTGAISPSGGLTYSGAVVIGTARMDFRNFVATSPTPGRFVGSFEMIWSDTTLSGTGTSASLAPPAGFIQARPSSGRPLSAAQALQEIRLIR
jgi:hypothetical protein